MYSHALCVCVCVGTSEYVISELHAYSRFTPYSCSLFHMTQISTMQSILYLFLPLMFFFFFFLFIKISFPRALLLHERYFFFPRFPELISQSLLFFFSFPFVLQCERVSVSVLSTLSRVDLCIFTFLFSMCGV